MEEINGQAAQFAPAEAENAQGARDVPQGEAAVSRQVAPAPGQHVPHDFLYPGRADVIVAAGAPVQKLVPENEAVELVQEDVFVLFEAAVELLAHAERVVAPAAAEKFG